MKKNELIAIALFVVLIAGIIGGFCYDKAKKQHIPKETQTPNEQAEKIMKENIKPITMKNTEENNVTKSYIDVQKDKTPIYETRRGDLILVGYLNLHQEFQVNKDLDKDWYLIGYGNSLAAVSKKDVSLVKVPDFKNVNNKYLNTKIVIITKTDTPVYDLTNNKKPVQFATIKENRRYPILYSNNKWWAVDIDGRIGLIDKTLTKVDKGIPVLMYHHFLEASENKLFRNTSTMTPQEFRQQMTYLHNQGYETITTEELEEYIKGKINLPGKAVLLTFDDGEKSVYMYAYPTLKQYHMLATEFMITSRIRNTPQVFNPNSLQFLSKPEMNSMKDVFEFQDHTNGLHNINKLKISDVITKPPFAVLQDIIKAKNILNATAFAYPFGQFNSSVVNIVKEAGLHSAYTTKGGYNNIGDNLFLLKRIGIEPETTFPQFVSIFR